MPFAYDSFLYDYNTFDFVKKDLAKHKFFNIINKHPIKEDDKYFDAEGYLYCRYMDHLDKVGYEKNKDFEYRLNTDLFRDDHFDLLSKENYNVLALGCSYTFGYGLPEEYSWPKVLERKMLTSKKNVKVYNLGSPGLGIDSILNNAISFIDKYGAPDLIVSLLPDMNRHIIYNPEQSSYITHTPSIEHIKKRRESRFLFYKVRDYVFEDRVYNTINQIRGFELMCKLANIKFLWHSWPENDIKLYSELNFYNYISPEGSELFTSDFEELPEGYKQYFKGARDDGIHPGIDYSFSIAGMFSHAWSKLHD